MVFALLDATPAVASSGLFVPRAPASLTDAPPGYRLSGNDATRVASHSAAIVREAARPGPRLVAHPLLFGDHFWLVRYLRGSVHRADVEVYGVSGHVEWTAVGRELAWPPIAHGEHTPQVHRLEWLMLLSAILFVAPFVEIRRLRRLLHVDLLAILALGVGFVFAEAGHVYVSTPLVYPPLLYLLGRLVWLALRGDRETERFGWFARRGAIIALGALLALRYGYALVDGVVNDVGYASLFGADSIVHGYPVYNTHSTGNHLDAYGPLVYLAYVPFILVLPVHDLSHDSVAAGQAAAIVFDLGTVVALYALGRRLVPRGGGRQLGLTLAWAYAACPWTLFVLARSTNDGLVALLLTLVLLAATSPAGRGLLLGLAVVTKFAPLAVVGVFARVGRERSWRTIVVYGGVLLLTVAVVVFAYLPDAGLRGFYNSTIGFQLSRSSPFSIWGLHPGLEPLRPIVTALAVLLALGSLFLPRDRSLPRLAASGAALIIAAQLGAIHWYWFYVPWFLPYAFVAFFSTSYAGSVRNSGSSSASAVASNSS